MAAGSPTRGAIEQAIKNIREKTYGKEVRAAIADGLEYCFNRVSGGAVTEATAEARAAARQLSDIIDQSESAMQELQEVVENASQTIVVSAEQPTNPENKIWIKPESDTEYRVASFDAYSALWDHVNELNNTYNEGHGGIVSILLDEDYVDESEENIPEASRRIKRYVITYADGTESDFLMTNAFGPVDMIQENGVVIEYTKGVINNGNFVKTPPTGDGVWSETLPTLDPGDYMWTRTTNLYVSGHTSTIYAVSQLGRDGNGQVRSVKLGDDGEVQTQDVVLPLDSAPTEGNTGSLVSSGGIWSALQSMKISPAFTGTPTAPTAAPGTNNTQIATTEFVNEAFVDVAIDSEELFDSPELTGVPTAPTPSLNDRSTRIATTEFCNDVAWKVYNETIAEHFAYPYFGMSHFYSYISSSTEHILFHIPPGSSHFITISSASPSYCSTTFIASCDLNNQITVSPLYSGSGVSFNSAYADGITMRVNNVETTVYDCVLEVVFSTQAISQLSDNSVNVLDLIIFADEETYGGFAHKAKITPQPRS